MSIHIITDSASDIEPNEFSNVKVLPMTITIDGVAYRAGEDMTKDEFYRILETSEQMPVTSLVSPFEFTEAYAQIPEGDEAIAIIVSGELSGTYQSAVIAAGEYENVSVIDSRQVAAAQKILVQRALQLIGEGKSRDEIVRQLEAEKNELVIFASVDTLKYLLKGGRISKSSAVVGGIIGIKPILTLEDGKLIAIGKARGSKQSHIFLNKKVAELGPIDFDRPYAVGYSGTDRSNLLAYIETNHSLVEGHELPIVQIGTTVGTHAGPGAVLVTFFSKKR